MRAYDVIVIGAGPAGSYSALNCAKKGLRTLLLDRQVFPRNKPCGGILEAKHFEKFASFLHGQEENITYYTSIYFDYTKIYVRPLKSYIFKRDKFDQLLVDTAIKNGVEFFDQVNVKNIVQGNNHVIVTWEGNNDNKLGNKTSANGKICIGADGVNSTVRRLTGLERFRQKPDKLISMVIKDAKPIDNYPWVLTTEHGKAAIASFFFSGFLGFAWLAPGKDTINVGIGVPITKAAGLRDRFYEFLTKLGLEHEIENAEAYTIPSMPVKQLYSNRIILVGDAAGTVNPWTGGGINLGFECALNAADAAAEELQSNNNGHSLELNLKVYQDKMEATLRVLRFKGKILRFVNWCHDHKLTSPLWERFFIRHTCPMV
jgi:geranylgeranyl reductase family protein